MEEKIILYSNDCPRCKILKERLDKDKIKYEVCNDTDLMLQKNFMSVPMLEADNVVMNYTEAIKWMTEGGNI